MIRVNDLVDDRYEVKARIDGGAMGEVFRVFDRRLHSFRAVKLLKDGKEHDSQWVERFKREAQAPSRIGPHPNVVAVHEYVSGHADDHSRYINHYMVMELAEGPTLDDLLNRSCGLPLEQAIEIMRGICNGVGAAHRKRIVHRDLKPKNVIVCPTSEGEVPKIIDFGLAKFPDASRGGELTLLTDAGTKLGTAVYRAPEQEIDPSKADTQADVYSLGCMFYEILSGSPPFTSTDLTKLVRQHQSKQPDPFKADLAIPAALEEVVMRALRKRASDRQKDANELGGQLIEAFNKARDEKAQAEQEARLRQEEEKWRRLKAELQTLTIENQDLRETEDLVMTRLKESEEARAFLEQNLMKLKSQSAQQSEVATEKQKKSETEKHRLSVQLGELSYKLEQQMQAAKVAGEHVDELRKDLHKSREQGAFVSLQLNQLSKQTTEDAGEREHENQALRVDILRLKQELERQKQDASAAKGDISQLQGEKRSLEQQIQRLRRAAPTQSSVNPHPVRKFFLSIAFLTIGAVGMYFGRDSLSKIGNFNWQWPSANANANNNQSAQTSDPVRERNDPKNVPVQPTSPSGMVYVPGGTFQMGRNRSDGGDTYDAPIHTVNVAPFFIDTYEVTNGDYAKFVNATHHSIPSTWTVGTYSSDAGHKPVTGVSWQDAEAYARWVGKRLPTEAEWEFAAKGTLGFLYPWGNEWNKGSVSEARTSGPVEVGSNPNNKSPFGAFDMVGNVWEWTASDLRPYPGATLPTNPVGSDLKVIRGCMYKCNKNQMTTTYRRGWPPVGNYDYENTGFRCAKGLTK